MSTRRDFITCSPAGGCVADGSPRGREAAARRSAYPGLGRGRNWPNCRVRGRDA
jgi:hypothetical protein